jgi:hypothetical protein
LFTTGRIRKTLSKFSPADREQYQSDRMGNLFT